MPTDKLYTGHQKEGEDLHFMQSRFYDAGTASFLSADTIAAPAEPASLNRYSYVNGNPLRYTDPTGHCPSGDAACQWNEEAERYRAFGCALTWAGVFCVSPPGSSRQEIVSALLNQVDQQNRNLNQYGCWYGAGLGVQCYRPQESVYSQFLAWAAALPSYGCGVSAETGVVCVTWDILAAKQWEGLPQTLAGDGYGEGGGCKPKVSWSVVKDCASGAGRAFADSWDSVSVTIQWADTVPLTPMALDFAAFAAAEFDILTSGCSLGAIVGASMYNTANLGVGVAGNYLATVAVASTAAGNPTGPMEAFSIYAGTSTLEVAALTIGNYVLEDNC